MDWSRNILQTNPTGLKGRLSRKLIRYREEPAQNSKWFSERFDNTDNENSRVDQPPNGRKAIQAVQIEDVGITPFIITFYQSVK